MLQEARILNTHRHEHLKSVIKAQLSLRLIKQHTMKTFMGVEAKLHVYLISELCGEESSIHAPESVPQGKESPVFTEQEDGWEPYSVSAKKEFSGQCRESNPGSSVAERVFLPVELS